MQNSELFVEPAQYQEIQALLLQRNNTYIIGPSGSGKTTCIHHCLRQLNIPFKRVNFLQCLNKSLLLEVICKEIQSLWKTQIRITKKFSELIVQLNDFIESGRIEQIERRGYIIIDAPQLPPIQLSYLSKLFSLSNIKSKRYQFNFIFICNQFPTTFEMPIGPVIVYRCLEIELQVKVIFNYLAHNSVKLQEYQLINQQTVRQAQFELAKDVVITFQIVTNNLGLLIQIAWGLFENYLYLHLLMNTQQGMGNKIQFNIAKKLLLENPNAQIRSQKFQEMLDLELEGNKNRETQKQHIELKNAAQTLDDQMIRLPKITALILLSTFYACRNSDKSDKFIFRDKKKNKKTKSKEQFKLKQKVSSHRVIAIAQSLMSLSDLKEYTLEKKQFNQTTQFYQQIQQLIEQGYLISHTNKDDNLNKLKLESQITEKQAFNLAESLGIHFYEFLHQS